MLGCLCTREAPEITHSSLTFSLLSNRIANNQTYLLQTELTFVCSVRKCMKYQSVPNTLSFYFLFLDLTQNKCHVKLNCNLKKKEKDPRWKRETWYYYTSNRSRWSGPWESHSLDSWQAKSSELPLWNWKSGGHHWFGTGSTRWCPRGGWERSGVAWNCKAALVILFLFIVNLFLIWGMEPTESVHEE